MYLCAYMYIYVSVRLSLFKYILYLHIKQVFPIGTLLWADKSPERRGVNHLTVMCLLIKLSLLRLPVSR